MARIGTFLQQSQGIFAVRHVEFGNRQRCLAMHDLHRLRQVLPVDCGAQHIVPVDDYLQCAQKGIQPLPVVEGQQVTQKIGVAFMFKKVMEQNPFLQAGERIDVLDVGRALWHLLNDQVDLFLCQLDQWKQIGCDPKRNGGVDRILTRIVPRVAAQFLEERRLVLFQ